MGKIWAVCSGSGGVGKSTIALALAAGAAKAGWQTILLDASGPARSCDLALGLESVVALDMADVITRQAGMEAALYPIARYSGLRFACASLMDGLPISELSGAVLALYSMCDILVIDLPTGEAELGSGILRAGDERIIVSRPDAASIRSAERLMARRDAVLVSLVINRVSRERIRHGTQYTRDAVENLLGQAAIAWIPEDPAIQAGEKRGSAAIEGIGSAAGELRALVKVLLAGNN